MQQYVKPEIKEIELETADIIQTSGVSYGGSDGDGNQQIGKW